jgi:hypothetical protein
VEAKVVILVAPELQKSKFKRLDFALVGTCAYFGAWGGLFGLLGISNSKKENTKRLRTRECNIFLWPVLHRG